MAKHVAQRPGRASRQEPEPGQTPQEPDPFAPRRGVKKPVMIVLIVVAVLIIVAESAYLVFGHFYTLMNYSEGPDADERAAAIAQFLASEENSTPEPVEDSEDLTEATEEEVDDIQAQIQAALRANGGSTISDADVVNILLIGSDARTRTESARSDVMMLVSLSKKTKKLVLTSFMRDIYTYIPDYGYNRLNAPYAIAGAPYLIETLEADFGVDIDNYAAVNFYDFADIIDALGGVDVALSNSEVDFINKQVQLDQVGLGVGTGYAWLDYPADGVAHLNGTQALAHCRNRSSAGSDADRTDRQRAVVSAIIEKARGLSLTELYDFLEILFPMVTTDLTQGDCLSLLLSAGDYLSYEVESIRIPAVDYSFTMINGMAVISIDFASNAEVVQKAIYG